MIILLIISFEKICLIRVVRYGFFKFLVGRSMLSIFCIRSCWYSVLFFCWSFVFEVFLGCGIGERVGKGFKVW